MKDHKEIVERLKSMPKPTQSEFDFEWIVLAVSLVILWIVVNPRLGQIAALFEKNKEMIKTIFVG